MVDLPLRTGILASGLPRVVSAGPEPD